MKFVVSLLMSILLLLTITVGCSSKSGVTDPDNNQHENNFSKGYTYTVEDGDLKLTYNNTGNTVTLIQALEAYNYTVFSIEDSFSNYDQFSKVISAQQATIKERIYFSIEPIHGVGITSYFIDLDTMEIYFIGQGTFVQEIPFDTTLTFAVLEDSWSSYLAFCTHAGGAGQYYYLGERLEDNIKEQLERAMSGNVNEPLYLSGLNNGDNVGGGLTIKDINYDKDFGEAFFTFAGEIRLTGVASFSEWENAVSFDLDENNSLPVIVIEKPDGTMYTHEIEKVHFRYCPSDKLSNFYGKTLEITVKDICVEIEFLYEARNYVINLIDFIVLD